MSQCGQVKVSSNRIGVSGAGVETSRYPRPRILSVWSNHTTNLGFKQWGTTFPGAACVVALVDRFAQHCHRVDILGESWRDKHRLDPDRPPPKPSRTRRRT